MNNSKRIQFFLVVGLVIVGFLINYYYWSNDSLNSMKHVPLYVMILAFVYILLQILKRYISKKQNWWDWGYYIGLIAVMLPTLLINEENTNFFNIVCNYGVLFLLLPVVKDAINTLKR
jgi:hypothetical protein